MKIKLLGKNLSEYPRTNDEEREIMERKFPGGRFDGNVRVIKYRLSENLKKEAFELFLVGRNGLNTTNSIIGMTRLAEKLGLLTDQQWGVAIPIIERGLEANQDYVKMLDEMSPILEKYCEKYDDLDFRGTFKERVQLECWQGRFSEHWANPGKEPEYK